MELFNRSEYDAAVLELPEEIEWDTSHAVPDGELFQGRGQVLGFWRAVDDRWQDFRILPERWIESEGVVLMLGRLVARGTGSGVPVEGSWDQVWRIEDGVPVRCENYTDRQLAWRAAGIEPESDG